ncbi:hypothetical protein [Halogeometricum limi]|uniref:Uncharacterized protein n=1 Tax=Halogeometricum limi TaxID=555875 RepID=A0A1I6IU19_9EURY|nr:hypothetical protein [Halogeometricum limi]SFR70227.1 hypothetical protein SAMN04488124_3677 [Halogeometricum limi]
MSDHIDDSSPPAEIDDTPTVSCSRCDHEWDLTYELDDLEVGNQSFEQFALDHMRHTGHFPDGISTWMASCRRCRDAEQFLSERPARRWAETHARHTRHAVELEHADEESTTVTPE